LRKRDLVGNATQTRCDSIGNGCSKAVVTAIRAKTVIEIIE
jgi:hypothetical protein